MHFAGKSIDPVFTKPPEEGCRNQRNGDGHHHRKREPRMKRAVLIAVLAATPLQAQDIVGLEDCARATSTDKKIGCLQANVLFLHQLIKKNQDAAQAQLQAMQAQLNANEAKVGALLIEIDRLRRAAERPETASEKK